MTTLNLNLEQIQLLSQGIANTLSLYATAPTPERKKLIDLYDNLIDLEYEIIKEETLTIKYQN